MCVNVQYFMEIDCSDFDKYIPLVAGILDVYGKYFQKLSERVQNSKAKTNEVAEEVILSVRTVRSFANEDGAARSMQKNWIKHIP